jgi:primosomal protein N' (replication factor Y)
MAEALPTDGAAPRAVAVLLPLPLAGTYDYAVPAALEVAPGDVVRVPLGTREVWGVVWGEAEGIDARRLKPIVEVLAPQALPEISRRFVDWVAGYTLAPPGSVMRMALSVTSALEPERPAVALARSGQPLPEDFRLTPARQRVLDAAGFALPATELARQAGVGLGVLQGLLAAGLLERVALPHRPWPRPDPERPGPVLSPAQAEAAAALRRDIAQGDYRVTLLDGVTGAGKTEVYLEAVAEALRRGRQVLVLLPEIALSQQWLERFKRRFGELPVAWHSELSGRQRRLAWRAVRSGEAAVVVGARSALFLPFRDLGLIVVDEEHEAAYKQEDGVIYHARDMAVVRASLAPFRSCWSRPPLRWRRCRTSRRAVTPSCTCRHAMRAPACRPRPWSTCAQHRRSACPTARPVGSPRRCARRCRRRWPRASRRCCS